MEVTLHKDGAGNFLKIGGKIKKEWNIQEDKEGSTAKEVQVVVIVDNVKINLSDTMMHLLLHCATTCCNIVAVLSISSYSIHNSIC